MYCLVSRIDGLVLSAYDWQGLYKTEFFDDYLIFENKISAQLMNVLLSFEFKDDEFYVSQVE